MGSDSRRHFGTLSMLRDDRALSYGSGKGRYRVSPGDLLRIEREGVSYLVLSPDDPDADLVTPGGVRLQAAGPHVFPAQFGIVTGRDLSPGAALSNVEALNRMLIRARIRGQAAVMPHGAVIEIANGHSPMCYPAGIIIHGNGCTIRARDETAPVVVASAWMDSEAPGQGTRIHGLKIEGTATGNAAPPGKQHGLVVYGTQGLYEEIVVTRVTGAGILLAQTDRVGRAGNGSPQGNRLLRPRIVECNGTGIAPGSLRPATRNTPEILDPVIVPPQGPAQQAVPGPAALSRAGSSARGLLSVSVPGRREPPVQNMPAWRLPDPLAEDMEVASTTDGDAGAPQIVLAQSSAWVPLTGGDHLHMTLPGASVIIDDVQDVYRIGARHWYRREEMPGFSDLDGRRGEWRGSLPVRGAVFCEFIPPGIGTMQEREGLFAIRLAGAPSADLHGLGVILRRKTGRVGFGLRPVSGRMLYAEGPSFHPGQVHRLFVTYDLGTGEVAVMLDGGSVFPLRRPRRWHPALPDGLLLWGSGLSGEDGEGFSGRGRRIQLFDARDLPA